MTMREQFEIRFPVPAGVAWSDEHKNYGWIKKSAFQRTITYRALWTGWQASREALVIELPEPETPESFDVTEKDDPEEYAALECRAGAQYASIHKCRRAIEAAGLKVTP